MHKWALEIIFFVATAAIVSWGSSYNGKDYHKNKNYQDEVSVFESSGNDIHVNKVYQDAKRQLLLSNRG